MSGTSNLSNVISQYTSQNAYNYENMVDKLIAENEMFDSAWAELNNAKSKMNENDYINETTQNLLYISNISHGVYYIFVAVLCLIILTLQIPVWAMVILIIVIIAFPLYIYSIERYLYNSMNYIHSLIMSIEYTPNDNI